MVLYCQVMAGTRFEYLNGRKEKLDFGNIRICVVVDETEKGNER